VRRCRRSGGRRQGRRGWAGRAGCHAGRGPFGSCSTGNAAAVASLPFNRRLGRGAIQGRDRVRNPAARSRGGASDQVIPAPAIGIPGSRGPAGGCSMTALAQLAARAALDAGPLDPVSLVSRVLPRAPDASADESRRCGSFPDSAGISARRKKLCPTTVGLQHRLARDDGSGLCRPNLPCWDAGAATAILHVPEAGRGRVPCGSVADLPMVFATVCRFGGWTAVPRTFIHVILPPGPVFSGARQTIDEVR